METHIEFMSCSFSPILVLGDVVAKDGVDLRVGGGVVAAPVVEEEGEGACGLTGQRHAVDDHVTAPVFGQLGQLPHHELDGLRADVIA